MKITSDVLKSLNDELRRLGCHFQYELIETVTYVPAIRKVIMDESGFVDSSIINCTDRFYKWLENFFIEKWGIKIIYNNTREICWSDDFVIDIQKSKIIGG